MIIAETSSVTDDLLDFHLFGPITAHIFLLILCGVLMVVVFTMAARRLPDAPKKTGFLALMEYGLVWVRDEVVYPWLGPEEGRKYLPFAWTLFFFVLVSNLLGLLPFTAVPHARTDGLTVATGNIAVTAALAIVVFVLVMGAGFKKHGFFGYFGSLVPPGLSPALVPFVMLLEFIGVLTRHFALAIRLFANMLAGHALFAILFGFCLGIEVFTHSYQGILQTIGSTGFLLFIMLFEVLMSLIQAYIFAILAVIFISLSTAETH